MTDWTQDRVETLRRLWFEGHSASHIAKVLGGVTRCMVLGKLRREHWFLAPAPRNNRDRDAQNDRG